MGNVSIRPAVHRQSLIPKYGLQIGERGDKWEEEFIKNIDFSTMDNGEDWSSLFRYSKASDFDLSAMDSSNVTNMDYLFEGVTAGVLRLNGLTIGPETTGINMFHGTFDGIDFTGAKFYCIPRDMFKGITLNSTLRLGTLDGSHLTSLANMFKQAEIPSVDLTGFNTSNVQNMSYMFYQASISEIIGLKDIDYSNVTTTEYMFSSYKGLIIDLSGIKFLSLENAASMFSFSNNYAIQQHEHLVINLSNCYFPVLATSTYMFEMSTSSDDYGAIDLILDGTIIKSNGLYAYGMFMYIKLIDNKGLDLSCLSGAKISYASGMFQYSDLGLTDFSVLDLSRTTSTYYMFYETRTPLIHLNTTVSFNMNKVDYLIYNSYANEIILELIIPPNIQKIYELVWPNQDNQIVTIKNSDIYAVDVNNFLYSSQYPLKVTFENTTLHVGHGADFEYFAPCYPDSGFRESYVDMSDLVVDGEVGSVRYMFGDPAKYKEIKFPRTGMKITGNTCYFLTGSWYTDSSGHDMYSSPIFYNLDKLDFSENTNIEWTICKCKQQLFDLRGWNPKNAKRIYYVFNQCEGDFNLSGWDVSKVETLTIGSALKGNLDVRNWDLTNATSITGLYDIRDGHYVDFDGWRINKGQTVSTCYLLNANWDVHATIYLPNTLYKPDNYFGTMFGGAEPYTNPTSGITHEGSIIDVYTNATSIEEQGWIFYHIYTEEEPYGYRIHWGTTHDDFLNAVGGD